MLKKSLNSYLMQQILNSFTSLTGIRTAFIGDVTDYIIGNNLNICTFCNKLRQQPSMNDECKKSDSNAFKIAETTKTTFLYKCHAGLWEAVIPLFIRNTHVGFLMLGQVKCADKNDLDWKNLNNVLISKGANQEKIEEFKSEYDILHEISKDKIEAAVKMLDIISQYIINSKVVDLLDSGPVEKARTYIDKYYLKKIDTKSIVNASGVSASYLSHIFHDEIGQTITSYIENNKLKYACELLIQTPLSIKEISALCGYEDQNYFSRVFRKRLGISPTIYKELNIRNNAANT
jgi:ligand-binding sensor protein